MRAAERYSLSTTGRMHSHVLWDSSFTKAMCKLVSSVTGFVEFSGDLHNVPVIWLLLADIPEHGDGGSPPWVFTRNAFIKFLWDILYETVMHQWRGSHFEAVERLMEPSATPWSFDFPPSHTFQQNLAEIMVSGMPSQAFNDTTQYIARPLL